MMKNNVLKKHYLEERIVLKTVSQILLSPILYLLFSSGTFAQVPINGFCQYEKFPIENKFFPTEGYPKNVFALNFNKDSFTDIVLFNPDDYNAVVYKGSSTVKVTEPVVSKLPFRISAIHHLNSGTQSSSYAFISRKDRRVGLLDISASGRIKVSSSVKVIGYPENLSTADINHDGVDEILVSGCSYEGLSVFKLSNGLLEEKKIAPKNNFSSAVFVDLSNDNNPDIAAIDLMDNSIKFFYNNSLGDFEQVREIRFAEKISNLKTYDFNLDNFNDLIFIRGKEIDVLTGDYTSSFENIIRIHTERNPYKFIIADLNSDGYNDIAYLDNSMSVVSVIYSKEDRSFYKEITYLNKSNLTDIVPFYSKFVKGIAALGDNSNLFILSNVRIIQDNTNISLGTEPDKIHYFDAGNDKIYDFYYLDKNDPYLNIIIRNNAGIPYLYYSIKMLEKHSDVTVDDRLGNKKVFYCYSKDKKLIEIITLNIDTQKYDKEIVYSSGSIFDLKIVGDEEGSKAKILVAFRKANNLRVQVFAYRDFRYTIASSSDIAGNVIDAKLVAGIPILVFYWQLNDKVYSFNKLELNADLKPSYYQNKFSVDNNKSYKFISCIGDILNREKNNSVNFIISQDRKYVIISTEKRNYKAYLEGPARNLSIENDGDVFLGEYRFNGLNRLFVYNKASESLERLDIVNKRNMILSTKLVDSKNLSSYFIKNLNFKKYYLVYTDKAEKCITIRELAD